MSDPSGRIIPIEFGNMLAPAVCGVCGRTGKTNQEVFADPRVYHEWDGNTYFCESCCIELASLFGAVNEHTFTKLSETTDALNLENIELRSTVAKLEAVVDAITSERLISRGVLTYDTLSNRYMVDAKTLEQSVQIAKQLNQGSNELESGTTESSSSSGPDDVSEPASDNAVSDLLSNLSI